MGTQYFMSGSSMKSELQLMISMRSIDWLSECLINCLFAWLLDGKGKLFTNFNFFEFFYCDILRKGGKTLDSVQQSIYQSINQSIDRIIEQLQTRNQSINGWLAWYGRCHAWSTNGGLQLHRGLIKMFTSHTRKYVSVFRTMPWVV